MRKTPAFYVNAMKRLDEKLHRAYQYAERHFGGQNLYIAEMKKNIKHAVATDLSPKKGKLRRKPPTALLSGTRAYPENLVIR